MFKYFFSSKNKTQKNKVTKKGKDDCREQVGAEKDKVQNDQPELQKQSKHKKTKEHVEDQESDGESIQSEELNVMMHARVGLKRYPVEFSLEDTVSEVMEKIFLHCNQEHNSHEYIYYYKGIEWGRSETKIKDAGYIKFDEDFNADDIILDYELRCD